MYVFVYNLVICANLGISNENLQKALYEDFYEDPKDDFQEDPQENPPGKPQGDPRKTPTKTPKRTQVRHKEDPRKPPGRSRKTPGRPPRSLSRTSLTILTTFTFRYLKNLTLSWIHFRYELGEIVRVNVGQEERNVKGECWTGTE